MIALAGVSSGCFQYVPLAPQAAAVGSQVRIELSDRGVVSVQPALGKSVTAVEGTVRGAAADSLTIALADVERRGSGTQTWAGETLVLKAEDIRAISERRLSQKRTTVVATGAITLAAAGIIAIAKASGDASGESGNKPPPVTPRRTWP
jgi:hypothetical protein